jgi:uncharacterized protein
MHKKFILLNRSRVQWNLINLPQLTFEVTDACNLKCKYCGYGEFYGNHDERTNKYLSVEKAITLLSYLEDYWNIDYLVEHDFRILVSLDGDKYNHSYRVEPCR